MPRFCDAYIVLGLNESLEKPVCKEEKNKKKCLEIVKKYYSKSLLAESITLNLCNDDYGVACLTAGTALLDSGKHDQALTYLQKACLLKDSSACAVANQVSLRVSHDEDVRREEEQERSRLIDLANEKRRLQKEREEINRREERERLGDALKKIGEGLVPKRPIQKKCISKRQYDGAVLP